VQPIAPTHDRFQAVFQAEFAYVCTSLRRLGVGERDLEDVAHDLFVEVWKRFTTYDPARPIKPWLFAFAFRFASDYRRLARHKVEVFVERDAEETAPRADELLAKRDAQRTLLAALESIDVERRAVFIMFELDEVPMQEIAGSLGIPTNTAYSRLRLAREEFQAAAHRLAAQRASGRAPAAREGKEAR
jgi:RNA polymerase sigma-70 factor (ECF subfamily)